MLNSKQQVLSMDAETMVKDFTDQLKEQKATIVELEKQLGTRKEQVLRLEGAIEALNMTLKKPEEDGTEKVK
jgi:archaellum component FlaC